MKPLSRIIALSSLGLVTLLSGCQDDDKKDSAKAIDLTILHTNDHHSYFDGQTYDLKLNYNTATSAADDVRLNLGGFARIASAISEYRDDNTLVLNSGELNGTLYFSLFKGEVDFKVFNAIGLDAYELGNHEFDEGESRLAELIDLAEFPVISGNIHPTSSSPLYGSDIQPYVIKEVDGELVAILGVLKVEKTRESSLVTDAVEFDEEIASVKAHVSTLQQKGVNKIIVLSHLGYDFDQVLARNVTDVDVIIGGDTHDVLDSSGELSNMGVDVHGAYPTVIMNPAGKPVYIAQAWEYAKGLGRMNISFDKQGEITTIDGNLELLVGAPYQVKNDSNAWVDATAEQQTQIKNTIQNLKTIREIAPDSRIEDILAPYKTELETFKNASLGTVTTTMPFTRIPQPFNNGDTPSGSYAAQVVADAFMQYLPKADVAIQNAGGVRAEMASGNFTVADAYTILPFSNTVVTIDMSGAEIVKVLNEGLDYAQGISGSTGAFPYSSNLRYDVTLGAPAGTGIHNVEVRNRATGVWSTIDMNATYAVATNSFTALGKDGYNTFADVRAANPAAFEESDVAYAVPLIEYFRDVLTDNILPPLDAANYCIKSVNVAP